MRNLLICCLGVAVTILVFPQSGVAQQANKSGIAAQLQPSLYRTSADITFRSQQTNAKLPEVNAGDLIGQTFSGIFMGSVSAFAVGIIVSQLSSCSGWCELGEFFVGASVGYIGGSSLMIHSYNNNPDQKGSYAAVLLGDIVGFGLGALTLNGLAESDSKAGLIFGGVAFFTFPVGGAMAGYFLSRKPVNPYRTQSLIKVSGSKASLSVPSVSYTNIDRFRSQQSPVISLVDIRF